MLIKNTADGVLQIIEIKGKRIYPKSVGQTYVTAEWKGFSVVFQVVVTE